MLQLTIYLIILALAVLSTQLLKKPGFALAICWSMLSLESVLQQGNAFLLSRSSFINIAVAGVVSIAAVWVVVSGKLRGLRVPTNMLLYSSLLLFAFVSFLWSLAPDIAWTEFKKALPYIATFAFIAPLCGIDEKQIKNAVDATVFFGGLLLIAIILSQQGRRGIYLATVGGKIIESNPLANATYAGIVAICALFSIYRKKTNLLILLLKVAIVGLAIFTIVKSGSRGQLLAAVTACFVWLPITAKVAAKKSTIVAVIFAFLVIVGSIYLIDDSAWSSRWQWEQITQAREGRFENVTNVFNYYWNTGGINLISGLGNSSSYRIIGYYPHNVPAEVLCEEGVIGLSLLFGMLGITYYVGLRAMNRVDDKHSNTRVHLGLLLSMITFQIILCLKEGSFWGSYQLASSLITMGWFCAWLKARHLSDRHQRSTAIGYVKPDPRSFRTASPSMIE